MPIDKTFTEREEFQKEQNDRDDNIQALVAAARRVIRRWESGSLAEAVNELADAVFEFDEEFPDDEEDDEQDEEDE